MKLLGVLLTLAVLAIGFYAKRDWLASEVDLSVNGPRTTAQRVEQYGHVVDARLKPDFEKAGASYPPSKITLVVLKQEKRLELYAPAAIDSTAFRFVHSYPILAASGHLGPKLRQGDWQVPEGIYGVESLNPNSHYHLALHVDYPNAFDRAHAETDGRTDLGGDIMIHGSNVSIGCVAMGNPTAEDLFVLAAKAGLPNVRLIFCPFDFRLTHQTPDEQPAWVPELYARLEKTLAPLPLPSSTK